MSIINFTPDCFEIVGQSNARGAALLANATSNYSGVIPDVCINSFPTTTHTEYYDASVNQFNDSGEYGFPPPFMYEYQALKGDLCLLFHYAIGATNLFSDWDPEGTGNVYEDCINDRTDWLNYLTDKGFTPTFKGLIYDQGESDSGTLTNANNYQANLEAFILNWRTNVVGIADYPVYIVQTSVEDPASRNDGLWTYQSIVQAAQQTVADNDDNVFLIIPSGQTYIAAEPTPNGTHRDASSQEAVAIQLKNIVIEAFDSGFDGGFTI